MQVQEQTDKQQEEEKAHGESQAFDKWPFFRHFFMMAIPRASCVIPE